MSQDKFAHVLAGIAVAAMIYPFGDVAAILGFCLAAFAKEIVWDLMLHKGTPDAADAVATMVGGTIYLTWMRVLA